MRATVNLAIAAAAALSIAACAGGEDPSGGGRSSSSAPIGVSASTDDANRVTIEWSIPASASPTGFLVLRDEEPIAELAAGVRRFEGAGAAAGSLGPPVGLEARSTSETVVLSWEPPTARPGRSHRDSVVAVYGAAPGEPSESVSGARASPRLLGYRLLRDEERLGDSGPRSRPSRTRTPLGTIRATAEVIRDRALPMDRKLRCWGTNGFGQAPTGHVTP